MFRLLQGDLRSSHALKRKESTKKRPGGKRRTRDGGRRLSCFSDNSPVSSDYQSFTRRARPHNNRNITLTSPRVATIEHDI